MVYVCSTQAKLSINGSYFHYYYFIFTLIRGIAPKLIRVLYFMHSKNLHEAKKILTYK